MAAAVPRFPHGVGVQVRDDRSDGEDAVTWTSLGCEPDEAGEALTRARCAKGNGDAGHVVVFVPHELLEPLPGASAALAGFAAARAVLIESLEACGLPAADSLSNATQRLAPLFRLCRDSAQLRALPDRAPDLYLPRAHALLTTSIHRLLRERVPRLSWSLARWSDEDATAALAALPAAGAELQRLYAEHHALRRACALRVRTLVRQNAPIAAVMAETRRERGGFRDSAFQDLLLTLVFRDPLFAERPLAKGYVYELLRALLDANERDGVENNDELSELSIDCMCASRTAQRRGTHKLGHRAYELGDSGATITLCMNADILNNVGLCAWPAGFLLAEWLLAHPDTVRDRRCVELGSGVGLTAAVVAALSPATLLATDYNDDVLRLLRANLELNGFAVGDDLRARFRVAEWDWVALAHSRSKTAAPTFDLVLAADVIYAPELVRPLAAVLAWLLEASPRASVLVCNAERNPETLAAFFLACEAERLAVEPLELARIPQRFFYERSGLRLVSLSLSRPAAIAQQPRARGSNA